jgi:hypothetical protein
MALPTINIKGREYTMVKDRILFFNETYPNGCIYTELISPLEAKQVVVKAVVIPDVSNPLRVFMDYSQATVGDSTINKTAALENASTSAVGRSLAMMGIGIVESVSSADEVKKALNHPLTQTNQSGVIGNLPNYAAAKVEFAAGAFTGKSTSFDYGHNREITEDGVDSVSEVLHFVPLTEKRNSEIQARLGELVKDKTLARRKLQIFLDSQHGAGKRGIDVSADRWEQTISMIEKAVADGPEAVKELLKKEGNEVTVA